MSEDLMLYSCLRNAVSLFHVIETELKWRQSQGKASGFESLKAHKPLVAVGSQEPLEDQKIIADYFRKGICIPYNDLGQDLEDAANS